MRPLILVSLDWLRPDDPRTSLGTASIAASLRAAGVEVEIVADAVNRPGFALAAFADRLQESIDRLRPSWLGIGAFVWNEPEVQALVDRFAAQPIVLGGPQISFAPPGTLEGCYPGARAFVRGHGERALVALATGLVVNGQDGLHLAGHIDENRRADIALDRLPSPHLDGTLPPGSFVRWETQRGCPFKCSFCQHREAGDRLTRRELGEARLHRELDAFAAAGTRRIAVLDPIFHANRARATALLQRVAEAGIDAHLSLQCRFEMLDDAFLDAVSALDVTLEFGLQTIHEAEGKAVRRPQQMNRVERWVDVLHRRGIDFEVSLIYGLPHQTLHSFEQSVAWCLDHGIPRVRAWPLMLLRGTPLYEERAKWGFVESTGDRIPIVVASHTFDRHEHREMQTLAGWLDDNPGVRAIPREAA